MEELHYDITIIDFSGIQHFVASISGEEYILNGWKKAQTMDVLNINNSVSLDYVSHAEIHPETTKHSMNHN